MKNREQLFKNWISIQKHRALRRAKMRSNFRANTHSVCLVANPSASASERCRSPRETNESVRFLSFTKTNVRDEFGSIRWLLVPAARLRRKHLRISSFHYDQWLFHCGRPESVEYLVSCVDGSISYQSSSSGMWNTVVSAASIFSVFTLLRILFFTAAFFSRIIESAPPRLK